MASTRRSEDTSHASSADREAIVSVALDYIGGWFDADQARMERALHPDLSKRSVQADGAVRTLTREMMLGFTSEGGGRREDAPDRRLEVEVNHIDGVLATAVVRCHLYVDYLQLVRTDTGWRILNVIWRRRQQG